MNNEEYLQLEHVIHLVRTKGYTFQRAVTVVFNLHGEDEDTIKQRNFYVANALRINEKR